MFSTCVCVWVCFAFSVRLLGIKTSVLPVVNQEINGILTTRYDNANRALEREAFLLQSQPDAVAILMRALRSRCKLKAP